MTPVTTPGSPSLDPSDHAPHVASEVGPLREVILHRPGLELRRLTPTNKDELLFDELVWVGKAQEEHDAFTELLTDVGVRVRHFRDLLADVVADPEVRTEAIAARATVDACGVELVEHVRGHLAALEPRVLADHLIGGVTVAEVPGAAYGFVGGVLGSTSFLVPPLPNAVFTRDPSAWVGDGVVLSPMQRPARQAERELWQLVYRHHPRFVAHPASVWFGGDDRPSFPATLEGGDVLVLSETTVAIGLSERTHPVAVENLAARVFAVGGVEEVIGVELPKTRGTMHLDTVLTMVDRDALVLWPRLRELSAAFRIRPHPDGGPMRVRREPSVEAAIADALGCERLRTITTGEDEVAADREQWDDGNNTLAVRPGVVVAYERNVDTNRRLEAAGVEVLRIPGSELPRGRGGPRCMSCPVLRGPLS